MKMYVHSFLVRRILVINEVPSGATALYIFLEMVAFCFMLSAVDAFGAGKPFLGSLIAALIFFVVGLLSRSIVSAIKLRLGMPSRALKITFWIALIGGFCGITWFALTRLGPPIIDYVRNLRVVVGGTYGRWFDQAIGAFYCITAILLFTYVRRVLSTVRRPKREPKKGFLEHKLDAERAMNAMPGFLAKLSRIMNDVAVAMGRHTQSLTGVPGTEHQLKVSKHTATSLDRFSNRVSRIWVDFARNGDLYCGGLSGWSTWMESRNNGRDVDVHYLEALRGLVSSSDASNEKMREYIESIDRLKGASSVMDQAADRHVKAWALILETTLQIQAASATTVRRLDALILKDAS